MLEETPENSNLSEVFITHFFVFRMSSTFFIRLEQIVKYKTIKYIKVIKSVAIAVDVGNVLCI